MAEIAWKIQLKIDVKQLIKTAYIDVIGTKIGSNFVPIPLKRAFCLWAGEGGFGSPQETRLRPPQWL